jgi:hypothetical protein
MEEATHVLGLAPLLAVDEGAIFEFLVAHGSLFFN